MAADNNYCSLVVNTSQKKKKHIKKRRIVKTPLHSALTSHRIVIFFTLYKSLQSTKLELNIENGIGYFPAKWEEKLLPAAVRRYTQQSFLAGNSRLTAGVSGGRKAFSFIWESLAAFTGSRESSSNKPAHTSPFPDFLLFFRAFSKKKKSIQTQFIGLTLEALPLLLGIKIPTGVTNAEIQTFPCQRGPENNIIYKLITVSTSQ